MNKEMRKRFVIIEDQKLVLNGRIKTVYVSHMLPPPMQAYLIGGKDLIVSPDIVNHPGLENLEKALMESIKLYNNQIPIKTKGDR
jgi:hypothetical protein